MGLAAEKVKLERLKTNLVNIERTLKERKEDCAWCKNKGTFDIAPNGFTCGSNRYQVGGSCSLGHNGGIKNLILSVAVGRNAVNRQVIVVLAEETKNEVYLKEQEILQQTFETDKSEQQVAQELAKAKQELEKLKVEAARSSAAMRLAEKGNMEGARALLGVQEAEGSWKKPVIITGIIIGALTLGFGVYKMIK